TTASTAATFPAADTRGRTRCAAPGYPPLTPACARQVPRRRPIRGSPVPARRARARRSRGMASGSRRPARRPPATGGSTGRDLVAGGPPRSRPPGSPRTRNLGGAVPTAGAVGPRHVLTRTRREPARSTAPSTRRRTPPRGSQGRGRLRVARTPPVGRLVGDDRRIGEEHLGVGPAGPSGARAP